ncbi:hypothetical protein ROS62_03750 [Streptomyces sp. DSM 41972]|uniref:L-amino acid ligase C-terminal domain-containing protein n=1 Tax=Streptomyces althioticus subsp. attaecolombicae TaxID=3075534 RepID=A0ABU3HX25_9ACTN|nr:hypothetical protein [Streptomyces sp. DSM 41972]SCD29215.1 hypothetical protein GA0115245_10075 [Streptomyces sp. di188]SCD42005.1 hypothetical protein GA0115238_10805 [Streptomyces sp. di50b]
MPRLPDATGVDLVEYQPRQTVGERVLPEVRAVLADQGQARRCEAIWFAAAPPAGVLVEVTGVEGPHPDGVRTDVLGKPGTRLDGLHSSDSRLAQARAHADTPEEALALAREAIGRLESVTRVTPLSTGLL